MGDIYIRTAGVRWSVSPLVIPVVLVVLVPDVPGLGDPGAPGDPVAVIAQDGHQARAAQGRVHVAQVHDMMRVCVI